MTGFAGAPIEAAAKPNKIAENNTGSNCPVASAPTTFSGIMLEMKAPKPCSDSAAAVVYFEISASEAPEVSKPVPGLTINATAIPIAKAMVETISKYSNAFPPIFPTFSYPPYYRFRLQLLRR